MPTTPRRLASVAGVALYLAASSPLDAQTSAKACVQKTISGSVARGETFTAPINKTLEFRLVSDHNGGGWFIWVGSANEDYVWVVTPPYQSDNGSTVGPAYGHTAREAVRNTPRRFAFVFNSSDLLRGRKAVDSWLHGNDNDPVTIKKNIDLLDNLRTGSLVLSIVGSRITDSPAPGVIESIKFRAVTCVPR
jgi:hypothetical protein